ncbi:MAG: cysteine--tRNA ligase [Gammaproteobacteria bacterium]
MLKIYNSLTGAREPFQPIENGKARIYVCGITVYDYCHLGHARMLVVFDMVTRYLRERNYDVTYVRNITDIDDKIIKRAAENNESVESLTERFIEAMNEDAEALYILKPDQEPRATGHVDYIIAMIEKLLENGLAYTADNGDVFYDVSKFREYGRLSGKKLDELRAGARVDVSEAKDDPLDFVLWKAAKEGEPSWDSPWGSGRPGWHIECSAMSTHCLGDHFDIHGGGQDLQFPHHENEIAQSVGATGKPFVNLWMHNGFVRVDEEKMSKSLGNFFTVREILQHYPAEVVRFFILSSHYRSPLNYSGETMNGARASLARLYTALRGMDNNAGKVQSGYLEKFHEAMDDDFNTPEAIAVMHGIAHELNRLPDKNSEQARNLAATLRRLGGILGLLQDSAEAFLQGGAAEDGLSAGEIEALIEQRAEAKKAKNFSEADRIREQLKEQGIILEDSPQGTTWRRN